MGTTIHRFEGKAVLITGAASGIGRATAKRFADEGASLMLGDIDEAGLAAFVEEFGSQQCRGLATDVRELEQLETLAQAAVDAYGRLDVVFNNAGIGTYGKAPDLDPEVWRQVIAVDLDSVFYGCRAAIPHLRKTGGGAIINTASISGTHGDYGLAAYNAAKGGVVNLTRTLALDHAREGIRVNAVCPGPIDTALLNPVVEAFPGIDGEYEKLVPMGRRGKPEEIAGAVAFLASEDASYITGAMLTIDGGVTAATGQPNFTRFFEGSN